MVEIPKIPFFKTTRTEIEFEIFTFDNLFSRQNKLKHPLDKPHRVEFYQILFTTKGSGTHFIDFQQYEYTPNSILFISKGQVHAYELNPKREGFILLFTEAFLSKNMIHSDLLFLYRLYNDHLQLPILRPEETGGNNLIYTINEIYEEYNCMDSFAKEDILRLLVKLFLLKIERIKHSLIPNNKNVEKFIKFGIFRNQIETHFTETRNANEYAQMMGLSYKTLNEICKAVTGTTAKQFIDDYIILEIKRHLATSDISIKELSYRLGFDEPTNFIKFFKKHTLHTPFQFKAIISK